MKTRLLLIFISMFMLCSVLVFDNLETQHAYAGCSAPLFGSPGPCFDSFMVSADGPLTERSIMENYARNIELNYPDWQMSDRDWDDKNTPLQLPAIICTEFVADGAKQYRMAKWVDSHTISSFENHRDDSLCDKWLAPIDDGIKTKWDKPRYLPNDVGIIQVIDKDINLDDKKIDSFDIHVWSDTDHDGIKLTITETDVDSGIFEGRVFFTTDDESGGTTLLVEDAVYAEHKSNVGSARIINESEQVCGLGTTLVDGVCTVIDNRCEPDMYGNLYCDPPIEDRLTLERFLFEPPIINERPTLSMGLVILIISLIIVVFVVWRKRK